MLKSLLSRSRCIYVVFAAFFSLSPTLTLANTPTLAHGGCQLNLLAVVPPEILNSPEQLFHFAKDQIRVWMDRARSIPEKSLEIVSDAETLALSVADRLPNQDQGAELLRELEQEQRNFGTYTPGTTTAQADEAAQTTGPKVQFVIHGGTERTLKDFRITHPRLHRAYLEWRKILEENGYPESLERNEYARFHDHPMMINTNLRSVRLSGRDRLVYGFRNGTVYIGGVILQHEYDAELPKIDGRMHAYGF